MSDQRGDERDEDRFGRGGAPPPSEEEDRDTAKPLGVPKGYTASGTYYDPYDETRFGRLNPIARPRIIEPRYFDGDQYAPRNAGPDRIWRYQQALAAIGLLDQNFTKTVWDENTANAWKSVLEYANQHGLSDEEALVELARGPRMTVDEAGNIVEMGDMVAQRPPLVIRTTDPVILKDIFRRASIDIAGVGWDERQVSTAVAAYNAMERQRQQAAYDKQVEGGEVVDIPDPESFIQAYVRNVDPEAVQEHEALGFAGEAMSFLSSPAWGVGG